MEINNFSTRTFYANSQSPKLATMMDKYVGGGDGCWKNGRIIRIGDFDPATGSVIDRGIAKRVRYGWQGTHTRLGDIQGIAKKEVVYLDKNGNRTVIAKNFKSKELGKGNFAYLKRTLQDGDVIELTMKQGKNGKYEPVVIKSAKNKLLSELPKVKEMLLKLDPLVKRFIKIAK